MMAKITSLGLASILVLFAGIAEQAHGADAEFCAIFNQFYAARTSGFMTERDERSSTNEDLWVGKQSFPDLQCSVGELFVQCKYIDPGIMDDATISRHTTMARKIDECISTNPGIQKTQVRRAHDTDTRGSKFYLSEGWEIEDGSGVYSISLIRSGLVLMYVVKH
jgi:hypothetical protein